MFDRLKRLFRRKPKPPSFDPPGLAGQHPDRDPHDPLHYRSVSPTERWLRGDDLVDPDQDEEDGQ